MIAYRFQPTYRTLDSMFDSQRRYPENLGLADLDSRRRTVSAYASLSDLAASVACDAVKPIRSRPCILEGPKSSDEGIYSSWGEILVMPTSVRWLDAELEEKFFATVDALFDLFWLDGWTWDQLRERARELL